MDSADWLSGLSNLRSGLSNFCVDCLLGDANLSHCLPVEGVAVGDVLERDGVQEDYETAIPCKPMTP